MKKKEKEEQKPNYRAEECDKIGEIAINYGFTIVIPPNIESEDISKAKQFREFDNTYEECEEKIAVLHWIEKNKLISEPPPLMIFYKKPLRGSGQKKKPGEEIYGFEIIGSSKSTSEAVLIKTALAVLSDLGYKDLYIDINSIGDKDSITKYDRDLATYFRKNAHLLPAKIRQEFKKNPYSVIADISKESESFRMNAPQTIESLSEISRAHFKEVLEYLEVFEVAYKIRPNLLSNKLFASHTIFEIHTTGGKKEDGPLLAYGYRYNYLAKKIGWKKDIQMMGMTIKVKKSPAFSKTISIKNIKKPKFYIVQLGSTAKLKALNIVEILRKNKLPVYHSVTKDKIGGQLSGADYMKATHLLIIGQKEAIDNTVVVRNINTREQETVSVSELVNFLKKLS